jgi:hypothetical protein
MGWRMRVGLGARRERGRRWRGGYFGWYFGRWWGGSRGRRGGITGRRRGRVFRPVVREEEAEAVGLEEAAEEAGLGEETMILLHRTVATFHGHRHLQSLRQLLLEAGHQAFGPASSEVQQRAMQPGVCRIRNKDNAINIIWVVEYSVVAETILEKGAPEDRDRVVEAEAGLHRGMRARALEGRGGGDGIIMEVII